MWRRMKEILQEWYDLVLEKVNWGAAFSKDQPAWNGMSTKKTVDKLLKDVATFHIANETWILVKSVVPGQRRPPTSVITSLITVATTKRA